ncbi:MAG: TetR/AcrR family transcriptional regulator [Acidobacteriota bacterium]
MRYPADQKAKTRQTILDAATRVFRSRGYQGGGVDAVMKEAGLTHGGFYSHFRNKEDLFAQSIESGLGAMSEQHRRWTSGTRGADHIRAFLSGYLSPRHRMNPGRGCPAPPLVSEIGRSGEQPRETFERGLEGWAAGLAEHLDGVPEGRREEAALGVIAACVGALSVSRAVTDPALADRILESTRAMIESAFLEADPPGPSPQRGEAP